MLFLSIVHHYLFWHYSRAFLEIFHVWLNFLWFVVHFFSIPQLMRSWVAPWKRMVEDRGNKWNLEDLAGYVIIGTLSRLIGFMLRSVIISIGLLCTFVTVIAGFIVYIFWVAAPLTIIALLVFGIALLVT
jgi:hypothetical protein